MPSSMELQQEISKQLKEGVKPAEIVAALLQAQIPEQEIVIAFERLGVTEDQIVNMIGKVSSELQNQPSPEEMVMMEQEQMPVDPNSMPEGMMPPQAPMVEQGASATPEQIAQLEQQLPQAQFGVENFNIPGVNTTGNEWMGQGHHFSRPKNQSNNFGYAGRVDSEGNSRELLSQDIIDRFQSNRQETDPYVAPEYETIREFPEFGIKDKLKNFIGNLSDKRSNRKNKNYAPPMFRSYAAYGGDTDFLPQAKNGNFIPPHQRGLNQQGIGQGGGSLYLPDYGTDQQWQSDILNLPKMPRPLYNNVMMHQNPLANLVTSVADFGQTMFSKKDRDGDGHSDGIFRRDTKEQKSAPGYRTRKQEWRDNKGAYQKHTINAGLNADGTPRSEADFKENYVFDQTNKEVLSKDQMNQRFIDNSSVSFDEKKGRYSLYAADNKKDHRRNIRKQDATDFQEFSQRIKDNPDQANMLYDYYGQTEKQTGIPKGTTFGVDEDGYGSSYAPTSDNPYFSETAMYENLLKKSHGGENLIDHDSMQKDLQKAGPEFLQAFMQVVDQGMSMQPQVMPENQGMPSYQYRGEINLNLPKLTNAEKIGLGTGATLGFASSFINPNSSISKNANVKNTAQQMCTDNTCPAGSNDWRDYTNRANMELGIGEDPNRSGYFSSDKFASGNVGKAALNTFGRTALGAGTGWLAGYGSQWLGNKIAPRVFGKPGPLFRQDGGGLPSFQSQGEVLDEVLDEWEVVAEGNPRIQPRPPKLFESPSLPELRMPEGLDQSPFSPNNPNSIFYNPASEEEVEETATENSMIGPTNNNVGPINNSMLSNTDDTDYNNLTNDPTQLTANAIDNQSNSNTNFNQVANMGNTQNSRNNVLSMPPLEDDDLPISTIDYDGDGVNDLYPKAPIANDPPGDDPEEDLSVDPSVEKSTYGDSLGQKARNWTNRQLDRPGVQKFGKFSEGIVNVADAGTDFLRYGKFLNEKNDKGRTQADKVYGMVAASDRGDQDENSGYFIDNKVVQMGGDPFSNLGQMLPPTPTGGEADVNYDTLLKLIAAGADIEIL